MPIPEALQSFIVDFFLTVMYEKDVKGEGKLIEKALEKFSGRGIPGLKTAIEEVGSGGIKTAEVDEVVQIWASNFGLDVKLDTREFFKQVLRVLDRSG